MIYVILTLVVGFLVSTAGHQAFSPARMFLYGWLLVLGSLALGMVKYQQDLSVLTVLVVASAICAFMLGTMMVPVSRTPMRFVLIRDNLDFVTLLGLGGLALAGIAFTLSDFSSLTGLDLRAIRDARWAQLYSGGAVEANPIAAAVIVSCLIVATLLPCAIKQRRWILAAFSIICMLTLFAQSVLAAGRATFAYTVLSLIISTSLVYRVSKVFTPKRMILGGVLGTYLFVIFPMQRNPGLSSAVSRYLSYVSDAEISEWVTALSSYPYLNWLEIAAYSTSYFSAALDKLNFFLTQTDVMSWYKMGLYNFTQLSQLMGVAGMSGISPWQQIRLDIASIMQAQGWGQNPWSTFIRDFGIDFGLFGALLVIGLFGFLCQYAYSRCLSAGSYVGLVAASYISIASFLTAFISPLQVRILSNGIWLLALIAIVRFIVRSIRRQKVSSHRWRQYDSVQPVT